MQDQQNPFEQIRIPKGATFLIGVAEGVMHGHPFAGIIAGGIGEQMVQGMQGEMDRQRPPAKKSSKNPFDFTGGKFEYKPYRLK